MAQPPIVGVFNSVGAAEEARAALLRSGLAPHSVTLSVHLTADSIAAEAPGQSFANQPGQPPGDSACADYGEKIRTGACTVSVEPGPAGRAAIEQILQANGAHITTQRPS
jgi:hypothetical protein